jgi:hypothetical protein
VKRASERSPYLAEELAGLTGSGDGWIACRVSTTLPERAARGSRAVGRVPGSKRLSANRTPTISASAPRPKSSSLPLVRPLKSGGYQSGSTASRPG